MCLHLIFFINNYSNLHLIHNSHLLHQDIQILNSNNKFNNNSNNQHKIHLHYHINYHNLIIIFHLIDNHRILYDKYNNLLHNPINNPINNNNNNINNILHPNLDRFLLINQVLHINQVLPMLCNNYNLNLIEYNLIRILILLIIINLNHKLQINRLFNRYNLRFNQTLINSKIFYNFLNNSPNYRKFKINY